MNDQEREGERQEEKSKRKRDYPLTMTSLHFSCIFLEPGLDFVVNFFKKIKIKNKLTHLISSTVTYLTSSKNDGTRVARL